MAKVNFSEYILTIPEQWKLAFKAKAVVKHPTEQREQSEWDKVWIELQTGSST